MNIVTLDFETYFDNDYTLSKMTTEAYIRDPRFEIHGVGIRAQLDKSLWLEPDKPLFLSEWFAGDDPRLGDMLKHYALFTEPRIKSDHKPLKQIHSDELLSKNERLYNLRESYAFLCHHAAFDGLILSHHFGVEPAHWLDTYSMAQYLFGAGQSKSLEALAKRFGLDPKIVPYDMMKGRHWASLSPGERDQVARGCLWDCELTYKIFLEMMKEFPPVEVPVIDLTVRMFTEPRLEGDRELLRKIHSDEQLSKNERLYNLGVGEKDLASADKFAAILEAEGVEVAYKPGKLKPIPALAKSDQFMQELLSDDDERIRELAAARLDVKSTINETRSARLGAMADRGRLAIYLHYCGAHTRRWSGGDDLNFQNLGRQGDLRRSIRAPDGYLLASPDQSQGECRILNWLAGQQDVIERFAKGEDPYIPMAKLLGAERQFGKVVELACGFGMGPARLEAHLKAAKLSFEPGFPERAVRAYRELHPRVVDLWRSADALLNRLSIRYNVGAWEIFKFVDGRLYHPNGTWLDYRGLRWEEGEWRLYFRNDQWRKMYGAKLVENVVQWLSRIVTAEAMVKFHGSGYPVVGMAHDDVWLLVPEPEWGLETLRAHIIRIMSKTPSWAPGLPLAAECKIGKTYS